jgi:hypothetical protein
MKVQTIKNMFKFAIGAGFATAVASQAYAGDIALAGSYGTYMQPGCGWVFASSNNYGPTSGVPIGATTNGVNVTIHYLTCSGNPAPQAVKVVATNFTFVYPNWDIRYQTSQTCNISAGVASVTGTCESHRVYN